MVKVVIPKRIKKFISQNEKFTPDQFMRCQWQQERNASLVYLLYRWIVSAMFLTMMLLSILDIGRAEIGGVKPKSNKWPIYFTNWGFTLCTVQALVGTAIVTKFYINSKQIEGNGHALEIVMNKTLHAYWILNSSALTVALGITSIYWGAVYDPKRDILDMITFMVHVCNSILMLVDLVMVAHPIRIHHCIFPIFFAVIYVLFNFFYFLAGGTDRLGRHYIYKIMDWHNPGKSLMVYSGCIVLIIVFHSFLWYLSILRRKLHSTLKKKMMKNSYNSRSDCIDQDSQQSPDQKCIMLI